MKFAENGTFKLNVLLYGEKEHDQKLTFYSRALCGYEGVPHCVFCGVCFSSLLPTMRPSIQRCPLTRLTPVFACNTVEAPHAKQLSPLCGAVCFVLERERERAVCFQRGMLSGAAEKHNPCQTQKATQRRVTSAQLLALCALPFSVQGTLAKQVTKGHIFSSEIIFFLP